MSIATGDHLMVRTARGAKVPKIATSGVEEGDSFRIVWVTDEAEYEAARHESREPAAVPWPADAVEPVIPA